MCVRVLLQCLVCDLTTTVAACEVSDPFVRVRWIFLGIEFETCSQANTERTRMDEWNMCEVIEMKWKNVCAKDNREFLNFFLKFDVYTKLNTYC